MASALGGDGIMNCHNPGGVRVPVMIVILLWVAVTIAVVNLHRSQHRIKCQWKVKSANVVQTLYAPVGRQEGGAG